MPRKAKVIQSESGAYKTEPASAERLTLGLSFATMLDWWMTAMEKNAIAHGQPRLTRTQGLLMGYITLGEHRPIRLAEKLGISRPAVHFLISRLVEQGALEVQRDPLDRRAQLVDFPAKNASHKIAYLAFMTALEDRIKAMIGPEKFEIFREVLTRDWGEPPLLTQDEFSKALTE